MRFLKLFCSLLIPAGMLAGFSVGGAVLAEDTILNDPTDTPSSVSVTIGSSVDVESDVTVPDTEYEFELWSIESTGDIQQESITVTEAGEFGFYTDQYSDEGIYEYSIVQVDNGATGFTYDSNTISVVIEVTRDDTGSLEATVSYDPVENTFHNQYAPIPVSVTLEVTNTINGNSDSSEVFLFELVSYESYDTIETIAITGAGTGSFSPLIFDQAGTYSYYVTIDDSDLSPAYQTGRNHFFDITITVSESDGVLEASVDIVKDDSESRTNVDSIEFVNDYSTVFDVTDFGAVGNDSGDDYSAFIQATTLAMDIEDKITIIIPAGQYYISSRIPVYSDTEIIAEGATITATYLDFVPMLYNVHADGSNPDCHDTTCTHGGYTQTQNITIRGGIWDRNESLTSDQSSIIIFRHAQNITISDMTVMNCTDHFFNLSGCNEVSIANVKFLNSITCSGGADSGFWAGYEYGNQKRFNSIEAVHTDYLNEEGESSNRAYPRDDTPTINLTVTGCTFDNVYAGIGTHHFPHNDKKRGANYTITGNKFINLRGFCVSSYAVDSVIFSDNICQGCSTMIVAFNSTNVNVTGNKILSHYATKISDLNLNYIYYSGVKGGSIEDNTLNGSFASGIQVSNSSSSISIKNNIIKNSSNCGIYVNNSSDITAQGNTINGTGSEMQAIRFEDLNGTNKIVSNIITKSSQDGIYVLNASATQINGNKISGIGRIGIKVNNSKSAVIKNNTISNCPDCAIWVEGVETDHSIGKTTCTDNTLISPGKYGIHVKFGNGSKIKNNVISNPGSDGVYLIESYNSTISDNSINGAGRHSIYLNSCKGTSVDNNSISTSVEYGIISTGDSADYSRGRVSITNNTIKHSGKTAIEVRQGDKSIISGNDISDAGEFGIYLKTSSNCEISNNQVISSTLIPIVAYGDNTKKTTALISNNTVRSADDSKVGIRAGDNATITISGNTIRNSRTTSVADTGRIIDLDSTAPTSSPTPKPSGSRGSVATPTVTPTTAPKPTTAPQNTETGVESFVERLYTVALGRDSDPYGKADWVNRVRVEGATGADLARGFLFSDEFLNKNMSNSDFLDVLYETFFNRPADEHKADWLALMDQGWSKTQVIDGFINSIEWANLCLNFGIASGSTAQPNITVEPSQGVIDFATRLYTTCLGRDADQGGLNDWSSQLANMKISGSEAAHGFFFSGEFIGANYSDSEYVQRLYRTFMGREYDQGGYDYWMNALASGKTREDVFQGFARSAEWAGICADYGILK